MFRTPDRFRNFMAGLSFGLLALTGLGVQPARAYHSWAWNNAAGGSTNLGSNWISGLTTGVPVPGDDIRFEIDLPLNIDWASPGDTAQALFVNRGRLRFSIANRIGITGSTTVSSESLTVLSGNFDSGTWSFGDVAFSRFLASGPFTRIQSLDSTVADNVGRTTGGNFTLNAGAIFYSNSSFSIANTGAAVCSATVSGYTTITGPPRIRHFSGLVTKSSLGGAGRGDLTVGYVGTGVLEIEDGGFGDIAGDLYVGRTSNSIGKLHMHSPPGALFGPSLTIHGQAFIGPDLHTQTVGTGTWLLEKGSGTVVGLCTVKNGTIQVRNGASLSLGGAVVSTTDSLDPNQARLDVVGAGSSLTISRSLEVGHGVVSADSSALVTYTGDSPLSILGDGVLVAYHGGVVQSAAEIDMHGTILLHGTIRAPLLKLFNGDVHADSGLIQARFSLPFASSVQIEQLTAGTVTIGDSTATDGFVSSGFCGLFSNTLVLLDKDGADLGNFYIYYGTLRLPQGGRLRQGFLMDIHNGRIEGVLTNEGTLRSAPGDTLDIAGRLVQRSGAEDGPGTLRILAGGALSARGVIGSSLILGGSLSFERTPSRILDSLSFQGLPGATMNFSLGSRASGRWDTLVVLGPAQINGTLALRTGPITFPQLGDTLTILTASLVSGTFSAVTVNGVPNGSQVKVIYGPTSVKVAVIGAITGVGADDAEGHGKVPRLSSIGTLERPAFALSLTEPSRVRLVAYDVSGRELAVLADGSLPAGTFRYPAPAGSAISGVIFVRGDLQGASGRRLLHAQAVRLR